VVSPGETAPDEDPDASCGGVIHNVWYRYTAPSNGFVRFQTFGSNYDTFLAIYTGTYGSLTEVACNDDYDGSLQSRVDLPVTAGTTYHIMIASYSGSTGTLVFEAEELPSPTIGMIQAGSYPYPYNRLIGLGYSVSLLPLSADINTFRQYDIVYLPVGWADGFSGNYAEIETHAADYRTYVNEGGGLITDQPNPFEQPNESVSPSLLPYPITFYNPYNLSDWPPIIVNPDHYITRGLLREDMPGPADQITAIDPAYAVLVRGQATNSPSLAVTEYGQGRIVIQTDHPGNGRPSDEVYRRMIAWVSSDVTSVDSFSIPSGPTPVSIKKTTP